MSLYTYYWVIYEVFKKLIKYINNSDCSKTMTLFDNIYNIAHLLYRILCIEDCTT